MSVSAECINVTVTDNREMDSCWWNHMHNEQFCLS